MGAIDWRAKFGIAVCLFVVAGFDMMFSTPTSSAGVLMFIAVYWIGEALFERRRGQGGDE